MGNITTNMPEITSEHDCRTDECKGELFKGLKLDCNQCDKSWRLECVIKQDSVYELAVAIGLVVEEEKKNVAKVNDETKAKFGKIIGGESLFEFACITCREKGKTRERIKEMETEIERWKEVVKEKNEKCDEMEKKNNDLQETINENQRVIQQMTDAADNPESLGERDGQSESNVTHGNNDENKNDYEKIMKRVINNTIPYILKREMDKVTNKINEKLVNECRIVRDTFVAQTEQNKSKQHVNRSVTFSDELRNMSHEQTEEQNNHNIQFDENLRPARQTTEIYRGNKVYEIYVSKFECDAKTDIVEEHIYKNTQISNLAYTIDEVRSNNNERNRNYKAFKITTLTHENYEKILRIWAPRFVAREFRPSTHEKGKTKMNEENRTEMYGRTPTEAYRSDRDRQYTPRKNTPMNNRYDKYATPRGYENNRERERQHSDRFDRQNRQQQNWQEQNTNTSTGFLDRNRNTQQGANRQFHQGGRNPFSRQR